MKRLINDVELNAELARFDGDKQVYVKGTYIVSRWLYFQAVRDYSQIRMEGKGRSNIREVQKYNHFVRVYGGLVGAGFAREVEPRLWVEEE